jgi:hypothetical protein
MSFEIRRAVDDDRAWIDALMLERWSGPTQVANGREYRPAELPGFIAVEEGSLVGYALFEVVGDTCWVALLQSLSDGRGIGSGLVRAGIEGHQADDPGVRRGRHPDHRRDRVRAAARRVGDEVAAADQRIPGPGPESRCPNRYLRPSERLRASVDASEGIIGRASRF